MPNTTQQETPDIVEDNNSSRSQESAAVDTANNLSDQAQASVENNT